MRNGKTNRKSRKIKKKEKEKMGKINCKGLNIKDIMRSGLAGFPFMNRLFHSAQNENDCQAALPFHYNN